MSDSKDREHPLCKRPSFGMQKGTFYMLKAVFRKVKDGLL